MTIDASNGDSQGEEEVTSKPKPKTEKKSKTAEKKVKPSTPSPRSPSTLDTPTSDEKLTERLPSPPKEPEPTTDRRVSTTSSVDEMSRKSSIDEEPATETPQSPPHKKVSSVQVESDWSSGDEFKSSDNNDKPLDVNNPNRTKTLNEDMSNTEQSIPQEMARPSHNTQSLSDSDQIDRAGGKSRPAKHLPRKYQMEGEGDLSRKETHRPRDPRSEKRYITGPSSPSPTPPGFGTHRRRPYYSPPPEQFERSRHRKPRPYSPPRGHRRHSRSPQRFHSPSPRYPVFNIVIIYKNMCIYCTIFSIAATTIVVFVLSSVHRPRSPPPRPKEVHSSHRYDSPPRGGRYSHRGSPHSPSHRFQRSTSPSFPRSPGQLGQ